MRCVKHRLHELLPDLKVFLDVDDLTRGKGADAVDVSSVVLVFCSDGYFSSINCMRELLRAVLKKKPIVAMFETDAKHGAITIEQIEERLCDAKLQPMYAQWGLDEEVKNWKHELPTAAELYAKLFAVPALEYNRTTPFQDVTLRLLAERLIPRRKGSLAEAVSSAASSAAGVLGRTYIQGEASFEKVKMHHPPHGSYHVFCSGAMPGFAELVREASESTNCGNIWTTRNLDELASCEHFLVYLHGKTWTSGEMSDSFAQNVRQAMDAGINLLLVYETVGGGRGAEQKSRFACTFEELRKVTPPDLIERGVYNKIALGMKGGPWRKASMIKLAKALNERAGAD